ncbi:MAG: glycosyltransferase [Bdellovibrionales bacterium]
MRVSFIICTYKQAPELRAILENLKYQTFQDFELVVCEDAESEEILDIVNEFRSQREIKLVQHEDSGFRRAKTLNGGVNASTGDYLIFSDGDCIPHTNFVETHMALAEESKIVSARRVMLGPNYSRKLIEGKLNIEKVQAYFFYDCWRHFLDRTDYYEEGLFLDPNSLWRRFFKPRPMRDVLGANLSLHRKDLFKINGFDEDYVTYGVEDNDLLWRLRHFGIELKSGRNSAITYHLGKHELNKGSELVEANRILMAEKQKRAEYRCLNGLEKLL